MSSLPSVIKRHVTEWSKDFVFRDPHLRQQQQKNGGGLVGDKQRRTDDGKEDDDYEADFEEKEEEDEDEEEDDDYYDDSYAYRNSPGFVMGPDDEHASTAFFQQFAKRIRNEMREDWMTHKEMALLGYGPDAANGAANGGSGGSFGDEGKHAFYVPPEITRSVQYHEGLALPSRYPKLFGYERNAEMLDRRIAAVVGRMAFSADDKMKSIAETMRAGQTGEGTAASRRRARTRKSGGDWVSFEDLVSLHRPGLGEQELLQHWAQYVEYMP